MKPSIQACFNKAATSYDANSDVQQSMGKKLISMLQTFITDDQSVIDLGCGTGMVTKNLFETVKFSRIVGIDLADELLKMAHKRLANPSIEFHQANFANLPLANESIDHVFSNMALHWSHDFNLTLQEIFRIQKQQGIFAMSLPLQGTLAELAQYGCRYNDFWSKGFVDHTLQKNGYEILHDEMLTCVVKYKNMLTALRLMKKTGTNFITRNTQQVVLSKSQLTAMRDDASLTYVIYLVIAKKTNEVIS